MTDREKLIDLITELENNLIQAYPYTTDEYRIKETADHLIANGVTVQRWIPVTERLPEPFEDMLAYDSTRNLVKYAYMTRHKEWIGIVMSSEVTHWMPLPEPPKEGAR